MTVDWTSVDTHVLVNPRMPVADRARMEEMVAAAPSLPAHVWLATSGTTGGLKATALAKRAMLASAEAVNRHLAAQREDIWQCVLPAFHVGGLAIYARASLTGSQVIESEWEPSHFARATFTLSALVPAQLRDLVRAGLRPSPSVRAIVIGGGVVPDELYGRGRALGWPILPSYGMTECCSQVATATLESSELRILPHMHVRVVDGLLAFAGPALLTGYATERGFVDPKESGWFVSEDRGEIDGDVVHVQGRAGEFVKVGGESVDLLRLDAILDDVRGDVDAAIVAVHDERLEYVIHLACVDDRGDALAGAFNLRVHPFERVRAVHRVASIPRTALGKLIRARLAEELG